MGYMGNLCIIFATFLCLKLFSKIKFILKIKGKDIDTFKNT